MLGKRVIGWEQWPWPYNMIIAFQRLKIERMVESGRFQEEVMSDFLKAKWGSGRWMRRGEWKQIAHYLNRGLLMNTEICSRLLQLTDASSWFVKSENRTHSRVPLFPQGIHLARCTPSSSSLPSWSSTFWMKHKKLHAYFQGSAFKKTNCFNSFTYCKLYQHFVLGHLYNQRP